MALFQCLLISSKPRETGLRPGSNALWYIFFSDAQVCLWTYLGGHPPPYWLRWPTRLKAKTKIHRVLIRDLLFADEDAVLAHSAQHLQALLDCFSLRLASKELASLSA